MATRMRLFEKIQRQEIGELLSAWRNDYPNMGVLSLVAEPDREIAIPALQELCSSMNVPLRGAIFPALLSQGGFRDHGCILARFDVMPYSAIYEPLSPSHSSSLQTIERMTGDIVNRVEWPGSGALFMIFDQMVANIATILDGLYLKLADRVHYTGVNAGSETFCPIPCIFDNVRVVQDGALVTYLPHYPGAVVEHCYVAPDRMISATSTEGNRIITIDWRPAFEVYREVVENEYGVKIDRENFYQYAVHFPFGIVRAAGDIVVRIPVKLEEDGSLFCVGEVPPDAVLTLMRAPEVDSLQTVETMARGLSNIFGSVAGADILTFYCAGRRIHLGDRAETELVMLHRRTGAGSIAGALSLGEIGHSVQWGYPIFHNGALLCCKWDQT